MKKLIVDDTAITILKIEDCLSNMESLNAVYNAIITAIATGSTRLSEISSKVGEETSACAAYIKNLISLGIIKKEMPFAERSTRKTIYKIDDNL